MILGKYTFSVFQFLHINYDFSHSNLPAQRSNYTLSRVKLCKQHLFAQQAVVPIAGQLVKTPGTNRHIENIKTPFSGDNKITELQKFRNMRKLPKYLN